MRKRRRPEAEDASDTRARPCRQLPLPVLVAVLVLGACSPASDGGTTGSDAPTTPAPAGRLEVRDDLVETQAVTWRSWRVVEPQALEFTVTAGAPDCHGVRPEVVESDSAVRVRLLVGRLPEAAERSCQAIALESVVVVPLAAPLGDRRVRPL